MAAKAWVRLTPRVARKPAQARATPERDLQRQCITWLRRVMPGAVVAAVINEQRGSGATAEERARFGVARKRSGALSGFPDVVVAPSGAPTFYLELKAPKGVLSEAQKAIHAQLRAGGHHVLLVRSLDDLEAGLMGIGVQTIVAGAPL